MLSWPCFCLMQVAVGTCFCPKTSQIAEKEDARITNVVTESMWRCAGHAGHPRLERHGHSGHISHISHHLHFSGFDGTRTIRATAATTGMIGIWNFGNFVFVPNSLIDFKNPCCGEGFSRRALREGHWSKVLSQSRVSGVLTKT